jgi:hypothetical protein
MSPTALMELEEKAQEVVDLEAVCGLIDSIYALDVSGWSDEHFEVLESVIDKTTAILAQIPSEKRWVFVDRLSIAREGVEQGVSPDPAKRPTLEEMRAFVSAHLS